MTKGQEIARTDESHDEDFINHLREKVGDAIDRVEEEKDRDPRLAALAITSLECGLLWAEKMADK